VRVTHDLASLDFTVLLKETSDLSFSEARINTSNEQIRTPIDGLVIVSVTFGASVARRGAASNVIVSWVENEAFKSCRGLPTVHHCPMATRNADGRHRVRHHAAARHCVGHDRNAADRLLNQRGVSDAD
jgi:hypothetical protein